MAIQLRNEWGIIKISYLFNVVRIKDNTNYGHRRWYFLRTMLMNMLLEKMFKGNDFPCNVYDICQRFTFDKCIFL